MLGGTIVFYNKTSDENFNLKGALRWVICIAEFYALKYAWEFFFPKVMSNLWIRKLWILMFAFILFSVQKYLYNILGFTRGNLTYLEIEEKWNDHNETRAQEK